MTYPRARTAGTGQARTGNSSNSLQPMKGAFLVLNEQVHEFITRALYDIGETYSDERAAEEPEEILLDLVKGTPGESGELSGLEWRPVEDDFGKKAYVSMPYALANQVGQDGELRVTVIILKKDGTMNIDIRTWGKYR